MPGKRKRTLPVLSATELAKRLEGHPQCTVSYRNGKYVITRRWNNQARGDPLHENSQFNDRGIRTIMRQLGFTDREVADFFER